MHYDVHMRLEGDFGVGSPLGLCVIGMETRSLGLSGRHCSPLSRLTGPSLYLMLNKLIKPENVSQFKCYMYLCVL